MMKNNIQKLEKEIANTPSKNEITNIKNRLDEIEKQILNSKKENHG